jgi:hypothetical protein
MRGVEGARAQRDGPSCCLNQGNGAFAPASRLDVGGPQTFVVAADLDADLDLDLATGIAGSLGGPSSIAILWNEGRAAFTPPLVRSLTGFPGAAAAAGDFDGDGLADLAFASSDTGECVPFLGCDMTDNVSILFHRGAMRSTSRFPTPRGSSRHR